MTTQPTQPSIIGVILTYNEGEHIAACIHALTPWVDRVVVWDSMSTDATCALAQAAGGEIRQRPFDNFAAQRQAALDTLSADWIVFVDADERLADQLGQEIRDNIARDHDNPAIAGYWLPRRNFLVGHETRGAGYFPDYQLRVLRRAAATYDPTREVHEIVDLDGEARYLSAPLLHYNYQSWAQFHAKQRHYAGFEARILASRGIRPRPHNFILQPLREFTRRYWRLEGWRDGLHGLRLCLLLAWYYGFLPYWLLWCDVRR